MGEFSIGAGSLARDRSLNSSTLRAGITVEDSNAGALKSKAGSVKFATPENYVKDKSIPGTGTTVSVSIPPEFQSKFGGPKILVYGSNSKTVIENATRLQNFFSLSSQSDFSDIYRLKVKS